jgi:hypothetical protein
VGRTQARDGEGSRSRRSGLRSPARASATGGADAFGLFGFERSSLDIAGARPGYEGRLQVVLAVDDQARDVLAFDAVRGQLGVGLA